jgi:hypothetical protein
MVAFQAQIADDLRGQRAALENLGLILDVVGAVVGRFDLKQRFGRIDPRRGLWHDHQGGLRGVNRLRHQQVQQGQ